jgi:hypothetical protein
VLERDEKELEVFFRIRGLESVTSVVILDSSLWLGF